ncbi:MAG: RNase adapter RapZ [Desulfatibacillaceae bacterium]
MERPRIIIITGLSGAGMSTALASLEDHGYFCVDNLPVPLLPKFLELHRESMADTSRLAFGMDLREKAFLSRYRQVFQELENEGYRLEIIFLEASEDVLVRRYSETRRQHPMSAGGGVLDGIRVERERLDEVRSLAHKVIDTSHYNVHELKAMVREHCEKTLTSRGLRVQVLSFGFKFGIPHDADLLCDVRFLPNPHFVPELRPLSGEDEAVRNFVAEREVTRYFLEKYLDLLDFLVPLYEKEGKSYLTIGIGCTGGRHRSVAIARAVYEHLRAMGREVNLAHRDMK